MPPSVTVLSPSPSLCVYGGCLMLDLLTRASIAKKDKTSRPARFPALSLTKRDVGDGPQGPGQRRARRACSPAGRVDGEDSDVRASGPER